MMCTPKINFNYLSMKTCLLLLGCVVVFAFVPAKGRPAERIFYFCVSKPTSATNSNVQDKQTVLYSGVHQIETEDAAVTAKAKVKQWETWVSSHCANKTGCTSDFNYYHTREEAKTAYTQILQSFSDTSKFLLKKVKFQ
jgi:hypothetical protein